MISTFRAVLVACLLALILPALGLAAAQDKPQPAAKTASHPALLDPTQANETAPGTFQVEFKTTKGTFVVEANRSWAPQGADRFYNLVKIGFFDDVAFFRVIKGFMVQFGIHGDPNVARKWRAAQLDDDPVKQSNKRGYLTFAHAGPNTRTTQLFINFGNNSGLDKQGFPAFAKVVKGMSVVDKIYDGYGEGAPRGEGPDQGRVQREGNEYLRKMFPKLDYIETARLVE